MNVLPRLAAALSLLFLVLVGMPVAAQTTPVSELAERLRSGSDFRVRTQAALALGASGDRSAVRALCDGLTDSNTTVRAAAAAALGRLALGGRDCLTQQLDRETTTEVRSVIQRALERLEPPPSIGPDTKFYVSIGAITNKSSRETQNLNRQVRSVLMREFARLPGFVVAPEDETEQQAKALLAKYKGAKGIYVWPKIEISFSGGQLRMNLELALFTYPGKDLKGSMARNLSMPDAQAGDVESENEMLQLAAERLVPDLAKNAQRI